MLTIVEIYSRGPFANIGSDLIPNLYQRLFESFFDDHAI